MNPDEKMARARAELVMDHPFFGSLALRMRLVPDPACAGMWTDGRTLGYRPALVDALGVNTAVGLLAHEMLHVVCAHHLRRRGRDETLWNRACDYAVNAILHEAGFALPANALLDPGYAGRSVDDIFAALLRIEDEKRRDGGLGDGGQKEATAETGPGGDGRADARGQAVNVPSATAQKPQAPPPGANMDVARGKKAPASGDKHAPAGPNPPIPACSARSATIRSNTDGLRIAITRPWTRTAHLPGPGPASGRSRRGMGDLPAGLARWWRRSSGPGSTGARSCAVPGAQRGQRLFLAAAQPTLRHMGLILPSLKNQELPDIVLAIDSSGSVSGGLLSLFCAEISSILADFDTRITVLFCDAAVREALTFSRFDLPLRLDPHGGGGTDFRPAFARVDELGLRPACLVYLTDMQCDRFPTAPDYPVLWAAYGPVGKQETPPFGEVARIAE